MSPPNQLPDELNDAELRFEQSLRTLRPALARLDVAAALAAAASRRAARRRTHFWQTSVAAAVFVVVGAWWMSSHRPNPGDFATHDRPENPTVISPVSLPPVVEPPTLMSYRRALAHSPAQLDELLDNQTATHIVPQTSPTPVDVFSLRHAEFPSSTGAM